MLFSLKMSKLVSRISAKYYSISERYPFLLRWRLTIAGKSITVSMALVSGVRSSQGTLILVAKTVTYLSKRDGAHVLQPLDSPRQSNTLRRKALNLRSSGL